ncbi:MAG: copper chaperone PCu(A)C [Acidimicrobiia bacterium]|nr:copper chaperone PCu(A)C [Acidimicrobiia bacterium]MDH4363846.1 copper chaperone PCu(A)C [Acidimicrobiia bacterium]
MLTTLKARRLLIGSGLALASLVGAACGSDSATTAGSDGTGAEATTGGSAAESAEGIEITGAWARTSPSSVDTGAAYLTIKGGAEDDTLLSASVDASVAGMAQIHEMVPVSGTGSESTMDRGSDSSRAMGSDNSTDSSAADGAMVMQEVKGGIEIPAGETVELAPGGYHVMLMELAEPLKEGAMFDLTLTFENAGEKTVNVEVRTEAP